MKNMKKFASVLVAIVLVLVMSVPAFAAKTWTGTITLKSAANVSVDGKTFKAYKILDAEAVSDDDLEKGVSYKIPENMQDFYNTEFGGDDNVATIEEVVDALEEIKDDSTALHNFAVKALAAAKAANIQPATATGANDKAEFTEIPFGYYVIEDEGEAPISALMLKSTSEELTIKADKPTIEKKIDGDKDGDKTTNGLVDYNTAVVGEKVPYVLTSYVPDMTGYTSYTYTVTDTFSKGLDFNDDVKVTIGGVEYTNFTVNQDGQTVTIEFNNFIELADKKGEKIEITYSATVNENAIVGVEGNPNTVKLEYSNNPQDSESKGETPDDTVYTYVVDLIINKVDENEAPLAGAEFEIRDSEGNVIATGTSDDQGKVTFTWVNGKGLKDGETYTIVETKAPAGYTKAADIVFTVNCEDPTAPKTECVWSSTDNKVSFTKTETAEVDDYFTVTVVNKTGSLLPETGGMGTTMFYVLGGLLVVGAAILLVTKKRMAYEA